MRKKKKRTNERRKRKDRKLRKLKKNLKKKIFHTPHSRVVFVIVPPIRLETAILIFCKFPFLLKETLSKISGISEAIGAKKNANRIELT